MYYSYAEMGRIDPRAFWAHYGACHSVHWKFDLIIQCIYSTLKGAKSILGQSERIVGKSVFLIFNRDFYLTSPRLCCMIALFRHNLF